MASHWSAVVLLCVVSVVLRTTEGRGRNVLALHNQNQVFQGNDYDDQYDYAEEDGYDELDNLKPVKQGMGVTHPPRQYLRLRPAAARGRRPFAAAKRRGMLVQSIEATGRRPDLAHIKNRGFHIGATDFGKTPQAFAINPYSGKPEPLVLVQPVQGRRNQLALSGTNRYQSNAFLEDVHAPKAHVSPFHYMRQIEQLKAAQQHRTAQAAAIHAARLQAANRPPPHAAQAANAAAVKPIDFELPVVTQPPPQQSSRTVDLSEGFCGNIVEIKDYCLGKPAAHYGHPNVLCYIQCDGTGAAFVRKCAEGTYWVRGYGPAGHNNCRKL